MKGVEGWNIEKATHPTKHSAPGFQHPGQTTEACLTQMGLPNCECKKCPPQKPVLAMADDCDDSCKL